MDLSLDNIITTQGHCYRCTVNTESKILVTKREVNQKSNYSTIYSGKILLDIFTMLLPVKPQIKIVMILGAHTMSSGMCDIRGSLAILFHGAHPGYASANFILHFTSCEDKVVFLPYLAGHTDIFSQTKSNAHYAHTKHNYFIPDLILLVCRLLAHRQTSSGRKR